MPRNLTCSQCAGPITRYRRPAGLPPSGYVFCSPACSQAFHRNRPLLHTPVVDRFWSRVDRTEQCWLWRGLLNPDGYGVFNVALPDGRRRAFVAHRWIYAHLHGPIPSRIEVCHNCDALYPADDTTYRRCVRPDHLWLGSHTQNVRDMWAKGRARLLTGVANGRAKLDAQQVHRIRDDVAAGVSQRGLARQLGLTHRQIGRIVRRESWADID